MDAGTALNPEHGFQLNLQLWMNAMFPARRPPSRPPVLAAFFKIFCTTYQDACPVLHALRAHGKTITTWVFRI